MWARVVEVMLSLYIILTPFYYPHGVEVAPYFVSHIICGVLLSTFALMSFKMSLRKMHLLSLLVSFFLLVTGYMNIYNQIVLSRSDILIGFILIMINIIPSFASLPPIRWIRFKTKRPVG